MSIRLPLKQVLDLVDTGDVGAGSVSGALTRTFLVPQDCDNVVLKLTASVVGGAVDATFQTTDDGGTTWYDIARTSIVSLAPNGAAQWLNIPVSGSGFRSAVQGQNSVAGATNTAVALNAIGNSPSSLGQSQVSGLPLLSTTNRVRVVFTGNLVSNDLLRIQVKANSQSPGN